MGGLFSLFGGKDAPQAMLSQYDINKSPLGTASTKIQDLGLSLSGYNRLIDPGFVEKERSYIGQLQSEAVRRQQMQLSGLAMGMGQARGMGLAAGAGWGTSGLLGASMRKDELTRAMDTGMQMNTQAYDLARAGMSFQAEGLAQGYLGQYLGGQQAQTGFGLQKAGQLSSMGLEQNMFNVGQQNQRNMADWQNKQSFTNSMLGGVFGMGSSVLGNLFAPNPTTNIYAT